MDIKVVLSLLAILTAAGVALFVDYRRTRDLRRREALVESRVRRREEERGNIVTATVISTASTNKVNLTATVDVLPVEEPITVTPVQRMEPVVAASSPESTQKPKTKDDEMQPKQALSNWLIQRAMARAAERAAADTEVVVASATPVETFTLVDEKAPVEATEELIHALPSREMEPALEVEVPPEPAVLAVPIVEEPELTHAVPPQELSRPEEASAAPEPAQAPEPTISPILPSEETVAVAAQSPETPRRFEEVVVDEFLWESLMSDSKASTVSEPSRPEPRLQVIQSTLNHQGDLIVPAGLHGSEMLTRLTESRKPFSGLVVSIGITEPDGRPNRDAETVKSVSKFVGGLMRAEDFLCIREDELLMICPGESGIEAQRRLSSISESLWDYQLQQSETDSMLLSMGGIDVQREPIDEAVASATERMAQTRRGRKAIMMPNPSQRRKAV